MFGKIKSHGTRHENPINTGPSDLGPLDKHKNDIDSGATESIIAAAFAVTWLSICSAFRLRAPTGVFKALVRRDIAPWGCKRDRLPG